ncbi:MAG: hypothetical protein HXX14_21865 [Bacteroidetes bacterium]|nr:hypothetical protein [Bacteroidota bacterium]NWJ53490.1 hypothetical protein [Bacteroidota bacterium]
MRQMKALLHYNSNLQINDITKSIIKAKTSRQQSRIITKVLDRISNEFIPFTGFLLLNPTDIVT